MPRLLYCFSFFTTFVAFLEGANALAMVAPVKRLALGLLAVSASALSPSDIPADVPVSNLVTSATSALAQGNIQNALTYFDAAITKDPQNYLTIFRRGAAYLQIGKYSQASHDFDRALSIKPTFEGALIQRAKISGRNGQWDAAKKDYKAAGKGASEEVKQLDEAEGAAKLSEKAEKAKNWGECTQHADVAITVASGVLELRQRRAHCRIEKGEIVEGLSDLLHVVQMSSSEDAYQKLSATYFFALDEAENGLSQIKKCMQSDPDSKPCRKLLKSERAIDKKRKRILELTGKRQFTSAVKLLVKSADDEGLLEEVRTETANLKSSGVIPGNAPSHLYESLVELTCEAYTEMNSLTKAEPFCNEALTTNPTCLPALIGKATRQIAADEFEDAVRTLNSAREAHGQQNQKVNELLQKAQTLLKRSKQKDYYKVLGVDRDADERDIKRAYRKLTVKFHPDKASAQGLTTDEAQKKMAAINEAYEVLSDPELKARFDRGDDPNDTSQQGNPFQGSPFGGFPGGQQMFFQQGGGSQFKFQAGGGGGGFQFPGGGFPF